MPLPTTDKFSGLSVTKLKQVLDYDQNTGIFRHKIRKGPMLIGSIAGRKPGKSSYIEICVFGKLYAAHRLAWFMMTGTWPASEIDHRDRDKYNNRFSNLREATHAQNAQNSKRRAGKTTPKGVYLLPSGHYRVLIDSNKKRFNLGTYPSIRKAQRIYEQAAKRLHKEFGYSE